MRGKKSGMRKATKIHSIKKIGRRREGLNEWQGDQNRLEGGESDTCTGVIGRITDALAKLGEVDPVKEKKRGTSPENGGFK